MKEDNESFPEERDDRIEAVKLLINFINSHDQIEPTFWIGACQLYSALISYRSGLSRDDYRERMKDTCKHYIREWENLDDEKGT